MPMMKAPYSFDIISTSGHSPRFIANEPAWVPEVPSLIIECQAKGAVVIDEEPPTPEPVHVEPAAPEPVVDNVDKEAAFAVGLDKALIAIIMREDPTDLKSDLTPKVLKVTAEMSPDLRRPTATEVFDAYARLQENIDLVTE